MSEVIAIVSGLPRSGTSMMMRMIEAGGVEVVVDNLRQPDEDNPKGYYEFEKVKAIKDDRTWLDGLEGKAVKMVSMLLYELPPDKKYKIIFMLRSMNEIIASQRTMLERRGETNVAGQEEMGRMFGKHLEEILNWLRTQKNMEVLYVTYNEVIENPRGIIPLISRFFDDRLDIKKMIEVVDKALYRQRDAKGISPRGMEVDALSANSKSEKEKIEAQLRSLGYM